MKNILIIPILFFLLGCAVGNQYDYASSPIVLPLKSTDSETLILHVQDLRPYVLNGKKKPNFVGIQRGGYGNPFDVTTTTGRPMTEDMADAMQNGLQNAGYRIVNVQGDIDNNYLVSIAVKNGAFRIVLLKVHDWKSDIYMGTTLYCDLRLDVFDAKGELLSSNTMRFSEEIGGGQLGADKNSVYMADEFAKRIGYLFNKDEVRRALQ